MGQGEWLGLSDVMTQEQRSGDKPSYNNQGVRKIAPCGLPITPHSFFAQPGQLFLIGTEKATSYAGGS